MSIIQIAPVTRRGMRLMISLYGMSETGKTLSGLKLAAGIEPDPSKRGLLDSEGGERGRAYVDQIEGGYLYGALSPPFTPERYVEALSEFEAAGVNVLVIDSISHSWFSTGGILDMVEAATEKNDMAKWKGPKRRLAKMTQRILTGDMHIILCSRGKEPMVEEIGQDGRKRYVKGPVVPIQEKSLKYDLTIMAQMLGDGRYSIAAPEGKCPGILRPLFAEHPLMNEDVGRALAKWVQADGGKTPEQRALEIAATEKAECGTAELRAWWPTLTPEQKAYLKPRSENYSSIARAADAEAEARRKEALQAAQNLDDPFAPKATADNAPTLSDGAVRAMTTLKACGNAIELDSAWAELPVEICRELGAGVVDDLRAAMSAQAAAE